MTATASRLWLARRHRTGPRGKVSPRSRVPTLRGRTTSQSRHPPSRVLGLRERLDLAVDLRRARTSSFATDARPGCPVGSKRSRTRSTSSRPHRVKRTWSCGCRRSPPSTTGFAWPLPRPRREGDLPGGVLGGGLGGPETNHSGAHRRWRTRSRAALVGSQRNISPDRLSMYRLPDSCVLTGRVRPPR
jgi:hypothetical protein